jgi:hypothetical protein
MRGYVGGGGERSKSRVFEPISLRGLRIERINGRRGSRRGDDRMRARVRIRRVPDEEGGGRRRGRGGQLMGGVGMRIRRGGMVEMGVIKCSSSARWLLLLMRMIVGMMMGMKMMMVGDESGGDGRETR